MQKCIFIKDAKLYIKAGCNLLFVLPSYKIMLHCRFSLFSSAFQLMFLFLNLDALCLYTQFTFSFVVVEHKKKKDQISLQTSTRNKQEDWRSSIFTHLSILRRNDVKGWFMSSILCLLYLLCNRQRLRKMLMIKGVCRLAILQTMRKDKQYFQSL